MTLRELKTYIDGRPEKNLDDEVVIDLFGAGYVSGVCAHVNSISKGFDWYHGKYIVHPVEQLKFVEGKCHKCGMTSKESRIETKLRCDFSTNPTTYFLDVFIEGKKVKSLPYREDDKTDKLN